MKEDTRIDPDPIPSEVVDKILASQEIRKILTTHLQPKLAFILMERFGLNHHDPRTRKDLGKQLGVCGNRVLSLEYKAICILRNKHSRRLAEILPSFS